MVGYGNPIHAYIKTDIRQYVHTNIRHTHVKIICKKVSILTAILNMETETQTADSQEDIVTTDDTSTASGVPEVQETNNEGNTSDGSTKSGAPPAPQKQNGANNNNAYRRLQSTNSHLRNEVNKLAAEIRRLQKSNREEDVAKAERLLDKAETFQTIVSNNEREQWEEEAAQAFGNYTETFLALSDKYGDYVNNNEPQLCEFIGTKYGMYLLNEWYKRMEVPQYAMEWRQMPGYKKGQVLGRFYDEIEKILTTGGNQTDRTKSTSVPAVSGGRQKTTVSVSDNDLSGNIDEAFKAFGF